MGWKIKNLFWVPDIVNFKQSLFADEDIFNVYIVLFSLFSISVMIVFISFHRSFFISFLLFSLLSSFSPYHFCYYFILPPSWSFFRLNSGTVSSWSPWRHPSKCCLPSTVRHLGHSALPRHGVLFLRQVPGREPLSSNCWTGQSQGWQQRC